MFICPFLVMLGSPGINRELNSTVEYHLKIMWVGTAVGFDISDASKLKALTSSKLHMDNWIGSLIVLSANNYWQLAGSCFFSIFILA